MERSSTGGWFLYVIILFRGVCWIVFLGHRHMHTLTFLEVCLAFTPLPHSLKKTLFCCARPFLTAFPPAPGRWFSRFCFTCAGEFKGKVTTTLLRSLQLFFVLYWCPGTLKSVRRPCPATVANDEMDTGDSEAAWVA